MKIQDLQQAIKNKNWKSEEYILEDFTLIDGGYLMAIGFSTGSGVWYWFTYRTKSGELLFEQRYSQNNGKTYKGVKTGWKAEDMIQKALKSTK